MYVNRKPAYAQRTHVSCLLSDHGRLHLRLDRVSCKTFYSKRRVTTVSNQEPRAQNELPVSTLS